MPNHNARQNRSSSDEGTQETQGSQQQEGSIGSGSIGDLAQKAQRAIELGLEKLDPQVVQWGQTALASATMLAAPVRRSFKTAPVLTGAGVAAIAAGGVMLAIAVARDNASSQTSVRPRTSNN